MLNNLRAARKSDERDVIEYRGFALPPRSMRFCGEEFKDDAYFVKSARLEAQRLMKHCGLTKSSRVLDVGCGPGRLATGLIAELGEVQSYHGLDVHRPSVEWCIRHIQARHPSFRFTHLDLENERYNPRGSSTESDFRLPVADASADVINLYSVFSHMSYGHVVAYLAELRRVLAPTGRVFLTAFVEEGVPNFAINPAGYLEDWEGALHCVRFERGFFQSMLDEAGFQVAEFEHGRETNAQSAFYLAPRT